MSRVAVLAVDGGNSKTDVALVNADGSVFAVVRGALSSPQHLGVDGALAVVEGLLGEALREAQLGYDPGRGLSLINKSEPTRRVVNSYSVLFL
jgi:N-acetylglucosamine kinase-like BadF-type ATPase